MMICVSILDRLLLPRPFPNIGFQIITEKHFQLKIFLASKLTSYLTDALKYTKTGIKQMIFRAALQ